MLAILEDKRAECLEEIAECEKELERAKIKLELLDEIISDAKEEAEAEAIENAEDYPVNANDPLVGFSE